MVRCVNSNKGNFKNGKLDITYHPIIYQSETFILSQINWITLVKEAYAIMVSFHTMAFYLCDAEVVIWSDLTPLQMLIKNKIKYVLTQNGALKISLISPHITFQHIKGKDNILADSLSHLQCLLQYKRAPQKNLVKDTVLQNLVKVKPFRNMHNQKTSHPPNPDMVTLVTDSNSEDPARDKHTFQVGDDIYKPEPHIQYIYHQIKWLQMKDPSLAIIMNKLQNSTSPAITKHLFPEYRWCFILLCKRRFPTFLGCSGAKEGLLNGPHYVP